MPDVQEVRVTNVDVPFWSLVNLSFKLIFAQAIAVAVAAAVLAVPLLCLGLLFGGLA